MSKPTLISSTGSAASETRMVSPMPDQHIAHADGRLDGAGAQGARLGHAQMQGAVDGLGQLLIGGDRQEGVGRLHRNLELVKIQILKDAGVVQRAFNHRIGAGLAVFFQQVLLQRPGVDADPHRTAVVAGRLNDLLHPVDRADVARVDAQAGGARLGRLDPPAIMEVDVGHQGHAGLARNGAEGRRRVFIRAGDADDVGPGLLQLTDLLQRRRRVGRRRIGHRLDADRGAAADSDLAHHDLAAGAALDMAPGTDVAEGRTIAHDRSNIGQEERQNHDRRQKIAP